MPKSEWWEAQAVGQVHGTAGEHYGVNSVAACTAGCHVWCACKHRRIGLPQGFYALALPKSVSIDSGWLPDMFGHLVVCGRGAEPSRWAFSGFFRRPHRALPRAGRAKRIGRMPDEAFGCQQCGVR